VEGWRVALTLVWMTYDDIRPWCFGALLCTRGSRASFTRWNSSERVVARSVPLSLRYHFS